MATKLEPLHAQSISNQLVRRLPTERFALARLPSGQHEQQIADLVLELTGKPAELKSIVPDRPGQDRRYLLESGKLRGWTRRRPAGEFEHGCEETGGGLGGNGGR